MTTDAPETPATPAAPPTHRPGRRAPRRQRSFWFELPFLIVIAFVLALVLRAFVVQAFYIPSESMETTLMPNDKVVVNKLSYRFGDIHRGDIIVFNVIGLWKSQREWDAEQAATEPSSALSRLGRHLGGLIGFAPLDQDFYIKRVIGVGGDKVACCDKNGRVTVNGHALDETSYLYPGSEPSETPFSVTVPNNRLWVMGDNRQNSGDSRAHLGAPGGGTVPDSSVAGRAVALVFPFDRATWFSTPATFDQAGLTSAPAPSAPAPSAPAPSAPAPSAPAPSNSGSTGDVVAAMSAAVALSRPRLARTASR